ncbi:SDR family oxidoreductase [Vibrio sp. ZSDZ34]|jgi:NAD(P)-dependent dehydrogenase (short-subunit alcohol dehydrogenase family)|uniref:SDR family oxidoreductase n=1 Tax=Vibrio gelatinilyticus TaxID=2893468 RepID=A0A9X1W9A7_9VIBR|nr:SDR family oxidoreductase [Vibrio gelatinilyticus]MCJ2376126.1 SDR family oxidoreductase [Vibrio gelatinilyticus]
MQNLFSLKGKTALITGASSGIGAHIAKTFALAGCNVIVAARRIERLDALVTELHQQGAKAYAVEMDVRDAASVHSAFELAHSQFGTPDIIINNAGISGEFQAVSDTCEEDMDRVFDVNFKGAWRVSKTACDRLIAQGKQGSIINLISIAAHGHAAGISSYAMSKTALLSLTKNLALEVAEHGIRVNAISPGTFHTEMTEAEYDDNGNNVFTDLPPLGREGKLSDLDGMFMFLASDASSFITGTCTPVDGGHLLRSL